MRHRLPLGRTLMYTALAVLAIFVLLATFVLTLGGGATGAIAQVTVHSLTTSPETYKDQTVLTDGTLGFNPELDTCEISGDGNFPIHLRYGDKGSLGAFVGHKVHVTGRFGLDSETGVYIEADIIRPSDP